MIELTVKYRNKLAGCYFDCNTTGFKLLFLLRTFPIVIGLPEAQAIERRLKGITIKRPQTHDLLANVIEALGAKLTSITVTKLEEHTYFASLDIRQSDGTTTAIDCRPSDAIAIGIGVGVPIYVDESVLQAALKDDDEDLP